jgi:PAS domain S-box-containing protein
VNQDQPQTSIPLESILVSADIGIWQYDHAADSLTHNLAFVAAAGLEHGMDRCPLGAWFDAIHPEDQEQVRREFNAAMAAASTLLEIEYRLRRADRSWLWVAARGRVVERDTQGRPLRSAGTIIDISERKQADFLLQIQHEFAGFLLAGPDRESLFAAILGTALRLPGLDCGGLYWRQPDASYKLIGHRGFAPAFVKRVHTLPADSPQATIIREGRLQCSCSEGHGHCTAPDLILQPSLVEEGLRSLVVLPIVVEGESLACLNLASHTQGATPKATVTALETLTRQFSQALSRAHFAEESALQQENFRRPVQRDRGLPVRARRGRHRAALQPRRGRRPGLRRQPARPFGHRGSSSRGTRYCGAHRRRDDRRRRVILPAAAAQDRWHARNGRYPRRRRTLERPGPPSSASRATSRNS